MNITAAIDITLTAADNGAGDHLTVLAGREIVSTGGSINLRAGDNLIIQSNALIDAAQNVSLVADFGNTDAGTSSITVTDATVSAGAAITGSATGNILFENTANATAGTSVSFAAGGNVTIQTDADLTAGTSLTATAGGAITVSDSRSQRNWAHPPRRWRRPDRDAGSTVTATRR